MTDDGNLDMGPVATGPRVFIARIAVKVWPSAFALIWVAVALPLMLPPTPRVVSFHEPEIALSL